MQNSSSRSDLPLIKKRLPHMKKNRHNFENKKWIEKKREKKVFSMRVHVWQL